MSRLGASAFIYFLSRIGISVAGFVGTFAIARLLGADALGLYTVAIGLGYFWLAIPTDAVAAGLQKRISENTEMGEFLASGLLLNSVLAMIIGGSVLFAGEFLSTIFDPQANPFVTILIDYTELLALLAMSSIAYDTIITSMKGEQQVGRAGVMEAVERTGRVLIQIALIIGGFGVFGLILGPIGSLIGVAVAAFLMLRTSLQWPKLYHFKRILSFAKYSLLPRNRVLGWMDTLVLSFFVASASIGIYEAAWGIASLMGIFSESITTTLFPKLSELSSQENRDDIMHLLNEAFAFNGLLVIPGLIGAILLGPQILRIYGTEFTRGETVLVILVAGYTAEIYGRQLITTLSAIDRPDITFRINLVFVGVNLALNVALIYQFGMIGAAIATAVSSLLWLVLALFSLSTVFGLPDIPFKTIGSEIFAALGMGLVVYLSQSTISTGNFYVTVVLVLLGAATYCALLWAISHRFRVKVNLLLSRFIY